MDKSSDLQKFRTNVQPALISKLEEFRLLGYDSVSVEGLWDYLMKKKWKKKKDEWKLYQIIDDILAVKVSDYISFATIEAYKTSEMTLDENDLKELLK